MRALIDRAKFAAAFGEAAAVVPGRTPKPVLQNVRLEVAEGHATLVATNLELGLTLGIEGVDVDQPGTVLLPVSRVGSILANDAGESLRVESSGKEDFGVRIRGAGTDFKLGTEDPDTFPSVPAEMPSNHYVLKAAFLSKMIRRTIFACDVESTRYALGGCLFEQDGSTLHLVATDGRRMARQSSLCEPVGEPAKPGTPVVPQRALRVLLRLLANVDAEEPVRIAYADTTILFAAGPAILHARLVEGRFPRYQDVFPAMTKVAIDLSVDSFLRACKQAAIFTTDESRGIVYRFGPETLKLEATAADVGNAAIELDVASPEKVDIVFDARYLLDALPAIGTGPALRLELVDAKNAAVFKTDDDYNYVVMPLTFDR